MPDGFVARIRAPLGALRRAFRKELHTRLHPRRRREALATLRERPVPRRILALCLGNICRSPYVEAYLRKNGVSLGFQVASGGFLGPGRPAPPEAQEAAARRGVDTGAHVSRLVDREALEEAELIILVDPAHGPRLRKTLGPHDKAVLVLGDLDPETGNARTIQDPFGHEPEVFERVFQRLDRSMDVLLGEWRSRAHG